MLRGPVPVVALGSLLSLVAVVALLLVTADWEQPTPIAGDPSLYGEIAADVLHGGVPYVDVTVEHLPLMLGPIVAIGAVATALDLEYVVLWVVATMVIVVVSVMMAGSVGLHDRYQARFAAAVLPMLPLVIFRLEVFVVVLVLAAIVAHERSRDRAGVTWSVLGALAKGWPISLLAIPFRRGGVRTAVVGVVVAVSGLLTVALLPGFQEGRAFTGIHSETLVGNVLLLARHTTGAELGLVASAGATYVDAPAFAVVLNALPGIALGIVALLSLLRTRALPNLVRACGLATLAIMLVSPLLSAQFVFWLAPFVPLLSRRGRWVAGVAGGLSTLLVALWNPHELWWALEVVARNAALLALGVVWVRETVGTVGTGD